MKRFSETTKWEDDWFFSLPPIHKLVFLFMVDRCDNAGFFEPSPTIHSLMIGISVDEYLGAIKGLNRGLIGAKENSGSKKVYIANFLRHQRNLPLNPTNNAHKQIIETIQYNLKEFNLSDIQEKLGADEGLFSPIGNVKVNKGNKKGGEGGKQNTDSSESETIELIVQHLNKKTNSQYRSTTGKTISGIKARLAEGNSIEDFILVIDDRSKEWLNDTKMDQYLRPETLFGNKFEGYLQNAKKQISSDPPMKYEILKTKKWVNCTKEELEWAYDHQHRTPTSYTEYPTTELLVSKGNPITRFEIESQR